MKQKIKYNGIELWVETHNWAGHYKYLRCFALIPGRFWSRNKQTLYCSSWEDAKFIVVDQKGLQDEIPRFLERMEKYLARKAEAYKKLILEIKSANSIFS